MHKHSLPSSLDVCSSAWTRFEKSLFRSLAPVSFFFFFNLHSALSIIIQGLCINHIIQTPSVSLFPLNFGKSRKFDAILILTNGIE